MAADGGQRTGRIRVGIVGTGIIAQVMHLHYLAELADRFEIAAVCDIAPENAAAAARRSGAAAVYTDWRELIAAPLDAVLILTSGSHAPMAIAAAGAGLHVFTEKPMCFSVTEGKAMVAAAKAAGVTLMVGYPKRYDPAFARFGAEAAALTGPRMLRVTTLESPFRPYVGHYLLTPPAAVPAELISGFQADTAAAVTEALGAEATELERQVYLNVLLDTLVHELNTVRGLLGEPTRLDYVHLSLEQVTVQLRFGDLPVAIHWIDLPGLARYTMEFALFAPDRRVTLSFPSPFLRNEPATVVVEAGDEGSARSWRTEEIGSYESGFKRELIAFHEAITCGAAPATPGTDGLADIALCQAIIECHRRGGPVRDPARIR
jgi:predicted dehydrogenase